MQFVGIVYRNICTKYGLEVPGSKQATPLKLIENDQAKILWDFQIQNDKMVGANQQDIVVLDKQDKKAVVIDVTSQVIAISRRRNMRRLRNTNG